MARIVFTASASADQAAILTEIHFKAGALTAAKFRSRFSVLHDRLSDYPESGAPRPALGPDIRIGIVPPSIIIYRRRAEDDTVVVLRVVHGRRQIVSRLLTE